MDELPENLSAVDAAELHRAAVARDERLTPLFHRWPRLTRAEHRDLHELWSERLRVAKHLGRLRVRARRPSG